VIGGHQNVQGVPFCVTSLCGGSAAPQGWRGSDRRKPSDDIEVTFQGALDLYPASSPKAALKSDIALASRLACVAQPKQSLLLAGMEAL
jgi:hypothetical protein